jgi:large subunit ribosomal protein L18
LRLRSLNLNLDLNLTLIKEEPMRTNKEQFAFRKSRTSAKINGTAERPRLCVYRGQKNIYAQVINDDIGSTVAAASTLSAELKGKLKSSDTLEAAKAVGELIGKKALEKSIKKVVFDRGGYQYHGRVKAFADAARAAGLEF